MKQWQRWYPKSWRARYGEEYDQLLEDLDSEHRLSGRDHLDVYRSGLLLHGSSSDGRRRILVAVMAVAIVGTGLGLGLGLGGGESTTGATFVAPLLTAASIRPGYLARPEPPTLGCTKQLDGQPIGPSGGPVGSRGPEPLLPAMQAIASGTVDGVGWTMLAARPSSFYSSSMKQLEYGGIALDGHWYTICPSFEQALDTSFEQSLDGGYRSIQTGLSFKLVDIKGKPVTYGVAPSNSTLTMSANQGQAIRPRNIATNVGGYSIFVGVFPGPACQVRSVQAFGVSLRQATQENVMLASGGCTQPIVFQSVDTSQLARNRGTVSFVGSTSIVVSNNFWPLLRVSIPSKARIFIPSQTGWTRGSLQDVKRCDYVDVAGTIGPTNAVASAIYVSPQVGVMSGLAADGLRHPLALQGCGA